MIKSSNAMYKPALKTALLHARVMIESVSLALVAFGLALLFSATVGGLKS